MSQVLSIIDALADKLRLRYLLEGGNTRTIGWGSLDANVQQRWRGVAFEAICQGIPEAKSWDEMDNQVRPVPTDLGTRNLKAPLLGDQETSSGQSPVVYTPSPAAMTEAALGLERILEQFIPDQTTNFDVGQTNEIRFRTRKVLDLIKGNRRF